MGKYALDSLFKRDYEGHPWKLEDLFLDNGKNNAAYLRAIEEVYENQERIDGVNYDKSFQDAFMKFSGIKIGVLTKAEILELQEMKERPQSVSDALKDFKYFEAVCRCIENISRKVHENGDIRDIKITKEQKIGLESLAGNLNEDSGGEIKKILCKFRKKIEALNVKRTEIENQKDTYKAWRNQEIAKVNREIDELEKGENYLKNASNIIPKLITILDEIAVVKREINHANKELTNLNFITGTDTKRKLLKKYRINYEILREAWPKVPVRLELSWNSKGKLDYKKIPETFVYSKALGFQRISVEDYKDGRLTKQLRDKFCKELKDDLLTPISYEDSKFIFPPGWEKCQSAGTFFQELISNYNKNIRNLSKDNKINTNKFEKSLELASEMLVSYYYPMAEELHKGFLDAQDRVNESFERLSEVKDKKELKRIKLSKERWEQREKPLLENIDKETTGINWVKAFDVLVSITSLDNQTVDDIDFAVNWMKTFFIGKLLTYSRFTDDFQSKLPQGLQDLNLSPLQSLLEKDNNQDESKGKNSEGAERSARLEDNKRLSYDPESVFMALWFVITREDFNLSNY